MTMSNRHWTSYWAHGHLTSLPQDFRANYDGEIAHFWQRRFAALGSGANILDACTGNGAVAFLAAVYGEDNNRSFQVTAVDAADISPRTAGPPDASRVALARKIRFIGGCRFEELDCADGSFDLVTSQYGLEYCDWDASATTVARFLKPGGALAVVSHAASSEMLRVMTAENAQYQRLDDLKILSALDALSAGRMAPAAFIEAIGQAAPVLRREFQRSRSELYGYVLGMVEQVLRMDEAELRTHQASLTEVGRQLGDGYGRLCDMLRVNRAITAEPEWHQVFSRHGLEFVESGDLRYRGRHHAGSFHLYGKPETRSAI